MRALLLAVFAGAAACGSPPPPGERSHAADAIIDEAKTPEERAQLTKVRDEIDAAARKRIDELDTEIARLRRENEELRQRKRSTN